MRDKHPLKPITIDKISWFYTMPKGLCVVAQAFAKNGGYLATTQATLSWRQVTAALKAHEKAVKS